MPSDNTDDPSSTSIATGPDSLQQHLQQQQQQQLSFSEPNQKQTGQRKRIARACDQCNQLRTRCDGKQPCKRCSYQSIPCEYERQVKKRGKGSHKYATITGRRQQQQTAAAGAQKPTASTSTITSPSASSSQLGFAKHPPSPMQPPVSLASPASSTRKLSFSVSPSLTHSSLPPPVDSHHHLHLQQRQQLQQQQQHQHQHQHQQQQQQHQQNHLQPISHVSPLSSSAASSIDSRNDREPSATAVSTTITSVPPNSAIISNAQTAQFNSTNSNNGEASEYILRRMQVPNELQASPSMLDGIEELMVSDVNQIFSANGHSVIRRSRQSSISDNNPAQTATIFVQTPGSTTPRWLNIKSPFPASLSAFFATPAPGTPRTHQDEVNHGYVYPVLVPILGSLDFLTPSLAADLLEVYFSNTIYGIGHFVRKSSILAVDRPPRQCSRALLYSFLYVAAHVSDHPHMTATPTSRTDIINHLLDLTIGNLQPLVHADKSGSIDDVMTYINLGIISSASEFKGASLRWWHAAWGLARVLKLNVEVPSSSPSSSSSSSNSTSNGASLSSKLLAASSLSSMSEEAREERRRVWWLLFLVDRHLGLCYNRPISVLDHESSTLYRPCRDEVWHSDMELIPASLDPNREKGLSHKVTGKDVWGYFLPIMTLLGGVVDLHQLEMNNTLAATREVTEPLRACLRARLDEFVKSIDEYDAATTPGSTATLSTDGATDDEMNNKSPESVTSAANLQQQQQQQQMHMRRLTQRTVWKEYCRCLAHVLHILVSGYWDPIEMLSLPPTMVLDPDFVSVIEHSLDFAKCIKRILEVDQDLRTIPFFFGIHMLQGSFTLLYIVDVLGDKEVRVACETIVRAHEVCIVTLNTEYQRNFRQIMRGALQMIDALEERRRRVQVPHNHIYGGSPPEEVVLSEMEDSKRRRRGLLNLYRWCRGGNGLAV